MKKLYVFPVLFLVFSILFACQLPTAVELKGTPGFRLAANMDIGSIFTQQLEEDFESVDSEILPCINTTNLTRIIHEDLFNEDLDIDNLPEGNEFGEVTHGTPLSEPKDLIHQDKTRKIPLSGLGNLLEGFTFNNTKSMLFVSGTDIISKLWLGITINDDTEQKIDIKENSVESGRDLWGNEYTWEAAPSGGYEIDLPLDGSDVFFKYRVYAETGEIFEDEDFEDAYIRVELVIWLPLEFIAGPDGAEMAFPVGSFFGESDLFGRESANSENFFFEIVESLSLDVRLNTNPFLGKKLIINSGENIEIREQISGNSLNFIFSEESIVLINDPANWPFVPVFKITFDKGDTLKLPRLFNAAELVFTASIGYRLDLGDSSPLTVMF